MSRPAGALARLVGASTLTAALLLCTTASARSQAETPSAERAPRVDVVTEGVFGSFQPAARVHIDRPGYVALFEVEPGVGATMLYPRDPSSPERLEAGTHALRLNGIETANRRLLMQWHLGWAFAQRPLLVPRNHLVAVASRRPLDVSGLLSRRIFHHSKNLADAHEVTHALLSTVTGDRAAETWNAARTSYDKHRDPGLLASFDVWLDAPFYPLERELAFTGYPPAGQAGFRVVCGAAFAATGEAVTARTAHDLTACRHAEPDRRMLADMGWEDPSRPHANAPRTDGRATSSVEENSSAREPLPEEVRETLRRIADAAEQRPSDRQLETLRRLESAGQEMRSRGIDLDGARLRTLRARAEVRAVRARLDARIRHTARDARIEAPEIGREIGGALGPRGSPGARRGSPTIHGSGSDGTAGRSNPGAGLPSPRDVRDRSQSVDRRDKDRPRSSSDG